MGDIALFRSCLRKEYRDQVIKMLRAVPGEFTRTAYRAKWVDPEALATLQSGENLRVIAFIVDQGLTHALPCRVLHLVEPPQIDHRLGVYRFVFEIGPFVQVPSDFDPNTALWSTYGQAVPPTRFVSLLRDSLAVSEAVSAEQSHSTWKNSIDFLTSSWPLFENTVFLRPDDSAGPGTPSGLLREVQQANIERLGLHSYNPHLSDEQLSIKRLHLSLGGVIGDVEPLPRLPRDGHFDVAFSLLESGEAQLKVEVRPDEQFSSYIPLSVRVTPNAALDPAGPRVLGAEWSRFLADLVSDAESDLDQTRNLLRRLSGVFPGDPELTLYRGRLSLLSGDFASARDEFEEVLRTRSDPRASWWSLIAALRIGDQSDVTRLLQRLDFSGNQNSVALFEEMINSISSVSDDVTEWFAGLPGAVMSEDKAVRILLELAQQGRSETAVAAVVRAAGELNPSVAIRIAQEALARNREWDVLRREVANIAVDAGIPELIEDDAEVLLRYSGGPPDDFLSLVHDLRPIIDPHRLPTILLTNAIRLVAESSEEAQDLALVLAYMAADHSTSSGDFLTAQHAINFMEIRLLKFDHLNVQYRPLVNQIVSRMTTIAERHPSLAVFDEHRLVELSTALRTTYENQSLVVFGGRFDADRANLFREELALAGVEWIAWDGAIAPDPQRLRTFARPETPLLIVSVDDGLISESIRQWLRANDVRFIRVTDSRAGWLDGLRLLIPEHQESIVFIPTSCADAIAWVRANCSRIVLCDGALDELSVIDGLPNNLHVARRIKDDLQMLNDFAERSSAGGIGVGLRDWAKMNGYPESKLAMKESDSTSNNPRFREARTFRIPGHLEPSGWIYMPAHLKLPGKYPNAARIHFSIDYLDSTETIYVGWVGPHLENRQT